MRVALGIAIAASLLAVAAPAGARRDVSPLGPAANDTIGPLRVANVELFTTDRAIDAVPADTPVGIRIWLKNPTKRDARDVVLSLASSPEVTVPYPTADFGAIAAGGTSSKAIGFEISPAGCSSDTLDLTGTIRSSLGLQPLTLTVNTDCPGPRLYVWALRYEGGNGDAIADPGERLNLFITLQNTGHDPATHIRGTLVVRSPEILVLVRDAQWPDIRIGSAAENNSPFLIQVSTNAPRRPVCGIPVVGGGASPTSTVEAVGFDAVVQVRTTGKALDTFFSSGVPCLEARAASTIAQARASDPVQAPSSRIPYLLLALGAVAVVARLLRARLSR